MMILTPRADYKFFARDHRSDPSDGKELDWKVVKETWVENVYHLEPDMFTTGAFVDVGANIGSVSLYVDSFNHSRPENPIKVFAIEPEPHNLKYLHKNIAANPTTENITVIEKAIWYKPGKVHISDRGGNSSLLLSREDDAEVEAITLKKLFKENKIEQVDALKVDIEGAEYDLLINTSDDTLSRIKFITLEFDANNDGRFGILVDKLSRQFGIQILGSPARGGYIYARLY